MIPGLKKQTVNFYDVMLYIAIAWKHARLTALLLTLSLTIGLTYYVFARPVYYSRSLVKLEGVPLPPGVDNVTDEPRIRAVMRLLRSPDVVERAVRKLGVKAKNDVITSKYVKKSMVSRVTGHSVQVLIWPYIYEWCESYPRALVATFLEIRNERRLAHQQAIIESYQKEMADVTERMRKNLQSRFNLLEDKQMTDVLIGSQEVKGLPGEIVQVRKDLEKIERARTRLDAGDLTTVAKLSLVQSLEEELDVRVGDTVMVGQAAKEAGDTAQAPNTAPPPPPSVVVVPSMVNGLRPWEILDRDRRGVEAEMAEASAKYLPEHRRMRELQARLDDIKSKLALEYEVARSRFELRYSQLLATHSELIAKIPDYQRSMLKRDQARQDVAVFDAGQLAWNNIYARMARELQEIDFLGDEFSVRVEFLGVTEKRDPGNPVAPHKLKIIMMAAGLGMLFAFGVPFLIEYLDHTLTSIEEIESTFQVRGLGIVPQLEATSAEQVALMDSHGDRRKRNLLENFRVIRTNLMSVGAISKAPQVTMVTSAIPKEGKTVVSANLALSFAQTGARTLLLDADLRRGRLHRVFGIRKAPGLSGVLTGQYPLAEAIRPAGRENLSLLTTGEHVDSGTELLGAAIFHDLMESLRRDYDRIVIDTPPVLGLSETSILQREVDGVVMVVWSGRTPIKDMRTALDLLHLNGGNIYGFILNRLDLSTNMNYYQYYYYSNEYYHSYHAIENS